VLGECGFIFNHLQAMSIQFGHRKQSEKTTQSNDWFLYADLWGFHPLVYERNAIMHQVMRPCIFEPLRPFDEVG
jgi:hypothetical protein